MLDEIPLRWFLGTIEMEQLRDLIALRLEDAEWAIQPGEARQAALMISLLLTHYIDRLEWLELIGVYTDNLPILAIRRHSSTLERLALRHPYGLGLNVDATTPSAIPLLLMALLQQEEDGASTPKASQLCQSSARPPIDPCTNAETSSKGSKDTPSQGKNEGNVAGCLAPALSCLASLELDMDERHMEQGDEPKILARLVRLPMLRSIYTMF
ncbi:hypothetical protein SCUCBS95973_003729 [Sporothrix curviconia]|uniref:Uncharacterized protein n=1 Tax=Sporothrix curviconia TaxID=1260050 RepID=A0ABP0BJ27_9PEZI